MGDLRCLGVLVVEGPDGNRSSRREKILGEARIAHAAIGELLVGDRIGDAIVETPERRQVRNRHGA
jgi:hypothetical protein